MGFCFEVFWPLPIIGDSAINEYLEDIFCANPCFQMGSNYYPSPSLQDFNIFYSQGSLGDVHTYIQLSGERILKQEAKE